MFHLIHLFISETHQLYVNVIWRKSSDNKQSIIKHTTICKLKNKLKTEKKNIVLSRLIPF